MARYAWKGGNFSHVATVRAWGKWGVILNASVKDGTIYPSQVGHAQAGMVRVGQGGCPSEWVAGEVLQIFSMEACTINSPMAPQPVT